MVFFQDAAGLRVVYLYGQKPSMAQTFISRLEWTCNGGQVAEPDFDGWLW
jgi:hypothetical protein